MLQKINVIADATHTKSEYLNEYIERFGHLADISFKIFEVTKNKLIQRCKIREAETGKQIPSKAINHHMESLENLKTSFDFSVRQRKQMLNVVMEQNENLREDDGKRLEPQKGNNEFRLFPSAETATPSSIIS